MGRLVTLRRIVPWILLAGSLGCYALAGSISVRELREVRAAQASLDETPPPAVPVDAFDAARDLHANAEVHVAGQIDPAMQYDLLLDTGAGGRLGVMIPLYPPDAGTREQAASAVLLYDQGPGGDTIGDAEISSLVGRITGEGAVGPLLTVGGQALGATPFDDLIRKAFSSAGRPLAEGFLVIAPFRGSREAALVPRPDLERPAMLGMLAVILTLGAMVFFARARNHCLRAAEATALPARPGSAGADEEVALPEEVGGLVTIGAYSPDMADGSSGVAVMRDVLALGRPSESANTYVAQRGDVDDFSALDSGGLKRALPGRAVPENLSGPKPVKKESPLAAKQDAGTVENIMAAVQAEVTRGGGGKGRAGANDLFAAIEATVAGEAAKGA